MTRVQQIIYSEFKQGLTVEQIAFKYALIPAYVERQLAEIKDKKWKQIGA